MIIDSLAVPFPSSTTTQVNANSPGAEHLWDIRQLTAAIARGDEEAFGLFYDRYNGRVLGLLMVLTAGHQDAARELHQLVMIKVARKLPVFDSESSLWAWLAQVTRNVFRDFLRARARLPKQGDHPIINLPTDEAAESMSDRLIHCLADGLQTLDDDERLLIEAFYFQEQSQAQIAKAKGQTVKAVESKLARTRAKLRDFLRIKTRHEN